MKLSALIPALAIVGATTVVHTQQPVRVMTRNLYHGVNTQIHAGVVAALNLTK